MLRIPLSCPRPSQTGPHRPSITNWQDKTQLESGQVHGLLDLNQPKPEAYNYLLSSTDKVMTRYQSDALRLDAVHHVSSDFWQRFNKHLHNHSQSLARWRVSTSIGYLGAVTQEKQDGDFDGMFDFPLYYSIIGTLCDGQPLQRLGAALSRRRQCSPSPVTFVDNHDLPRIRSRCGDNARAALEFLYLAPGTPSISHGTESAMGGSSEPDNRGVVNFRQTQAKSTGETQPAAPRFIGNCQWHTLYCQSREQRS